jgi:hypothetical protein
MGLRAKNTGGDFTPAPEGTFVARCVQVIDLGTQYSDFYEKSAHKILLGWELPDELDEGGRPFMVWKRYTLSLNRKAALRKDLEAWRGKAFSEDELSGFDVPNILGTSCMINVVHTKGTNGAVFSNVNSVMSMMRGTKCPPQVNESILFDIDNWDDNVFYTFSDNLQKTIKSCAELNSSAPEPQQRRGDAYSEPIDADEQGPNDEEPFGVGGKDQIPF